MTESKPSSPPSSGPRTIYNYVPSMRSFKKLIDHIARTGHGPKNAKEFTALGLAPNATDANQCLNVARKFLLFDAEGTLMPRGRKFRLEITRAEPCREILQEQYPGLNAILEENPGTFPKEQLTKQLVIQDETNSSSAIDKVLAMVKELSQGFVNKPTNGKDKDVRKNTEKHPKLLQTMVNALLCGGKHTPDPVPNPEPAKSEPSLQTTSPSKPEPPIAKSQVPQEVLPSKIPQENGMETLPLSIDITIDHNWSPEQVNLVFDRVEQILKHMKSMK